MSYFPYAWKAEWEQNEKCKEIEILEYAGRHKKIKEITG